MAAPPENPTIDQHQVNLPTGELIVTRPGASIGPDNHHGLTFSELWVDDGWRYLEMPTINGSSNLIFISYMGSSTSFENDGSGNYTPVFGDGSTLTYSSANDTYLYVANGGMEILFEEVLWVELFYPAGSNIGFARSVTFPDCVERTFHYETDYVFSSSGDMWHRWLTSITSNTGFQIKLTYSDSVGGPCNSMSAMRVATATAINNAIEYCDPVATFCALTGDWPTVSYLDGDMTDQAGDTVDYTYDGPGGRISAIRRPGGTADPVTFAYDTNNQVDSVTTDGNTWTYDLAGSWRTVRNPDDDISSNMQVDWQDRPTMVIGGGTFRTLTYCTTSDTNWPVGLLRSVTTQAGQTTTYQYNARGNVTQVTSTDSNGANAIITSATYPGSCPDPVTCNLPLTTTDAAGQVTNYTYNQTHGGLTQMRAPAASPGAPRATTIFQYVSSQARYLTAPGTFSNSAPITLPSRVRACRTAATCTGTCEEVRTTIVYPSFATPNNLLPSSVISSLGNNWESATTSFTYTDLGRPLSVDGPLAGSDDTSFIVYDDYGRQIGSVSGDPDGSGNLPRLASRITIVDGLVTRRESGTSTSTADLSGFVADQRQDIEYDEFGRPIIQRHRTVTGDTQHSVVQVSYDNMGRIECTALRMDAPLTCAASITPRTIFVLEYDGNGTMLDRYIHGVSPGR